MGNNGMSVYIHFSHTRLPVIQEHATS